MVAMTVPIREAALDRGQNGASNDNLCTSLWMRKSHGLRIQEPWLPHRQALRVYVGRAILLPVFGEEPRVIF